MIRYDLVILLLSIYPRELKRHVHKKTNKNVQSSIIHNSLKLETTQMFIHKKTDTYTVVYSHNGIWISNKKEQTTDVCNNMSKSQKSYVQQKEPNKKHT